MMIEWRQLSTMTKIFYIAGLVSFIGLAIMTLCDRNNQYWRSMGTSQAVPLVYVIQGWMKWIPLNGLRK